MRTGRADTVDTGEGTGMVDTAVKVATAVMVDITGMADTVMAAAVGGM